MCVCVYVCVYVCVCVCVDRSQEFFLLSLLRMSLLLVLRVAKRPGYSDCSLSKILLFSELFETFSLSPSSSRGSLSLFQEVDFFREF